LASQVVRYGKNCWPKSFQGNSNNITGKQKEGDGGENKKPPSGDFSRIRNSKSAVRSEGEGGEEGIGVKWQERIGFVGNESPEFTWEYSKQSTEPEKKKKTKKKKGSGRKLGKRI